MKACRNLAENDRGRRREGKVGRECGSVMNAQSYSLFASYPRPSPFPPSCSLRLFLKFYNHLPHPSSDPSPCFLIPACTAVSPSLCASVPPSFRYTGQEKKSITWQLASDEGSTRIRDRRGPCSPFAFPAVSFSYLSRICPNLPRTRWIDLEWLRRMESCTTTAVHRNKIKVSPCKT